MNEADKKHPCYLMKNVSFMQAIRLDLVAYLTTLLYAFTIVCLLLLIAGVSLFDIRPPRESPLEIFFGYLLLTGIAVAVIRLRMSYLTGLLRQGEIIDAEVLLGHAYQFYMVLQIKYRFHGTLTQRLLWLPNTGGPRAISGFTQVVLSVRTDNHRLAVIRNLYLT